MDSGFILKKLPTGFANGLDVGSEIPRGSEDDFKTSGLSRWKDGITLSRYAGMERGACWGWRIKGLNLDMLICTCPVESPVEGSSGHLAVQFWNLGERSRPESPFGSC